jgi:FAD/FMN-containing dehydrogenase
MVFQGLDQRHAEDVWRPFLEWVAREPAELRVASPPMLTAFPARRIWDPSFLRNFPVVVADDRPGAPEGNVFWAADAAQVGQVVHGYRSAWIPATLLRPDRQQELADALFAATRHWNVSLHLNKGLAGAPEAVVAAARDTPTNPAVLDAFALAICGAAGPPAYPGIPGREPDPQTARREAGAVDRAMRDLGKALPRAPGSYVSESDFFERDWQRAFWGDNYPKLAEVKKKYDPDGLFFVHHGVGSELWSADGFIRVR